MKRVSCPLQIHPHHAANIIECGSRDQARKVEAFENAASGEVVLLGCQDLQDNGRFYLRFGYNRCLSCEGG